MIEKSLQRRVLRELNAHPHCKAVAISPPSVETGTPDIIGCCRGCMFLIELKVGKNKPSALQKQRINQSSKSGACAIVAREDFDTPAFLEGVDE